LSLNSRRSLSPFLGPLLKVNEDAAPAVCLRKEGDEKAGRLASTSSQILSHNNIEPNLNTVIYVLPGIRMAKADKGTKAVKVKQPSEGKSNNLYIAIAAMDGNAGTPVEFEAEDPAADEVFFKADEDATEVRMHSLNSVSLDI
jgi:hypothetical protein